MMTYKINQQQFEAVLALPAKERYGHFVKRVADSEEAAEKQSGGRRCESRKGVRKQITDAIEK